MPDHNHMVPLIGGPLCGESMTIQGTNLPNSLPMYYENKFYTYNLSIIEKSDYTEVFYEFSNEIQEVVDKRR